MLLPAAARTGATTISKAMIHRMRTSHRGYFTKLYTTLHALARYARPRPQRSRGHSSQDVSDRIPGKLTLSNDLRHQIEERVVAVLSQHRNYLGH